MRCGFMPPTDSTGRVLSYREWREINGCPVSDEEQAARDDAGEIFRRLHVGRTAPPEVHEYAESWAAERKLERITRVAMHAGRVAKRIAAGIPITDEEEAARIECWAIEDTRSAPWGPGQLEQMNAATRRWRAATAAAYSAAGVDRPRLVTA